MKNFKSGGFKKSGGGFAGKSSFASKRPGKSFSGGDRGGDRPTEMFTATCAKCGKSCEVPFRPNGEKPVFCRDCFVRKEDDGGRDFRGGDRDRGSRDFGGRDERPARDARPSKHEFSGSKKDPAIEEVKRQLASLEVKLNKILDIINPPQPKKDVTLAALVAPYADTAEEAPKKERKPKAAVKKAVKKATKKTK